jgi:ectoine hydroxylase-related dioxygenase (phytanoyl-CoA dioxygenase family)
VATEADPSIPDVLRPHGVTASTLSPADRSRLEQLGFLHWPELCKGDLLERLRSTLEEVGGNRSPKDNAPTPIDPTGLSTFGRIPVLQQAWLQTRALAAVHLVLQRPFRLFSVGERTARPGRGLQGLHTDWLPRSRGEPFSVVTVLWMLDAFTMNNGATRVVPASHLSPQPLPRSQQAPRHHHPDEQVIEAPAGSVLLFNGHLWHSGTLNRSSQPRRSLQVQYIARDHAPPVELDREWLQSLPTDLAYWFGGSGR